MLSRIYSVLQFCLILDTVWSCTVLQFYFIPDAVRSYMIRNFVSVRAQGRLYGSEFPGIVISTSVPVPSPSLKICSLA